MAQNKAGTSASDENGTVRTKLMPVLNAVLALTRIPVLKCLSVLMVMKAAREASVILIASG